MIPEAIRHTRDKRMPLSSTEYSWNDDPIVVPVSLTPSEWNSIFIAFFIAEVTGSTVHLVHVKNYTDSESKSQEFLKQIDDFARSLKVQYDYAEIDLRKPSVGVDDIAKAIVARSKQIRPQAIIMAANREAFFRELFGRVSDRVVNAAICKVVLVETPWQGMRIPSVLKRILIPILREDPKPDPFIIASALSSSATTPDVEIMAIWVVPLPPTIPLDALENADILRTEEADFSLKISIYIRSIGRFFSPRLIAVRHVGEEVANFAREKQADLIILQGDRGAGGYRSFLKSEKYEIVSKSPSVVLVVYS